MTLDRLAGLKARQKDNIPNEERVVDDIGEAHGFIDRTPRKKPGRKPSPRTYQIHPKIFPHVGEEIADEAATLGITQGHLIEVMWATYKEYGRAAAFELIRKGGAGD